MRACSLATKRADRRINFVGAKLFTDSLGAYNFTWHRSCPLKNKISMRGVGWVMLGSQQLGLGTSGFPIFPIMFQGQLLICITRVLVVAGPNCVTFIPRGVQMHALSFPVVIDVWRERPAVSSEFFAIKWHQVRYRSSLEHWVPMNSLSPTKTHHKGLETAFVTSGYSLKISGENYQRFWFSVEKHKSLGVQGFAWSFHFTDFAHDSVDNGVDSGALLTMQMTRYQVDEAHEPQQPGISLPKL